MVNRKRTYRLCAEETLELRAKERKKLIIPRQPIVTPIGKNIRWSTDFVSAQFVNGRRFLVLNVVDDYSLEMVGQPTDFSISGQRVTRLLSTLIDNRSCPYQIGFDTGTEFTSKAMFLWQSESPVKLAFILPCKPSQNAYTESLNDKFRNECLDQYWFRKIKDGEQKIESWRHHTNNERPHSSLNYLTSEEFAKNEFISSNSK